MQLESEKISIFLYSLNIHLYDSLHRLVKTYNCVFMQLLYTLHSITVAFMMPKHDSGALTKLFQRYDYSTTALQQVNTLKQAYNVLIVMNNWLMPFWERPHHYNYIVIVISNSLDNVVETFVSATIAAVPQLTAHDVTRCQCCQSQHIIHRQKGAIWC